MEEPKIKVTIEIKNTKTDEVVKYEDAVYEDMFIWEEGNFSCDCNRCLFFERAKNKVEPDWDECECNRAENKYLVNIIDKHNNYWLHEF